MISHAQFFHKFGVGLSSGYRYNNSSIYLEACLKRVTINGEFIQNNYQGVGYGISADYYFPLRHNTLMPFFGVGFTRLGGNNNSLEWGSSQTTDFHVPEGAYIIPTIGLRYNIIGIMDREKYRRKGLVSFILRMGYRVLTTQQPVVVYESGSVNDGLKNKIQQSVDRGIGGSLGIVFGLGKKEMK